jgi:hypothetical protein
MEEGKTTVTRAILFSGHMIDAPDRTSPRFPPALEPAVDTAIQHAIDRLQPDRGDVAVCSGACGGDILFAEAMLDRGVPLRIYLPFDEPTFSVRMCGCWRKRDGSAAQRLRSSASGTGKAATGLAARST